MNKHQHLGSYVTVKQFILVSVQLLSLMLFHANCVSLQVLLSFNKINQKTEKKSFFPSYIPSIDLIIDFH